MITLRNVTLRRGLHVLLSQVNWTIYHKQRIGIIGANGAGKTSLFALLLQQLQPDVGDVELPKHIRLAHVAQEEVAYDGCALDFVLDGDVELRELEKALAQAEAANDGEKVAILCEKMSVIDAYSAPARAAQLLDGLGFKAEQQQKAVKSFSGGWRVRLNLAKALMCRSDVLLLDEPTNHLDLDAVLWLEDWLLHYPGTLLLISHDREFLDKTVDHIAHIMHQQFKLYAGNYSSFEKLRANALLMQQATYEKQQRQLTHMQSYVDRFRYKASKARQAQSRLKAIERLELVSAVQTESDFEFSFKAPLQCPNPLLQLDKASVAYGEHIVLDHVTVSITPKDRIAILGPNGAGKSSFIKLLADQLQAASGTREAAAGLRVGYFAQHQIDQLHLDDSPLLHLQRLATQEKSDTELRAYLGSFGFIGDRVLEPVRHFSGGEKSRLALALIVWQRPNLLLLDEPTNHLDMEMRNALSLSLQAYEGAMILVSHDRFLVRTTCDQLYLVADKKWQAFDGDLDDYQAWLLAYRRQKEATAKAESTSPSRKEQRQADAKQREMRRPLMQKIKKLEDRLLQLEKEAANLETLLADLSLYEPENKSILQTHILKQANIKTELETVEHDWLIACEERDNLA